MSQALVVPKLAFDTLNLVEIEKNVQVAVDINLPLFNLPLLLQPRSTCETDPNYLQIIPYVIIKDRYGYIFSYRRGSGGGEERLLKKCSIGFGGHVEESLDDTFDRITKVANLLSTYYEGIK